MCRLCPLSSPNVKTYEQTHYLIWLRHLDEVVDVIEYHDEVCSDFSIRHLKASRISPFSEVFICPPPPTFEVESIFK